MAGICLTCLCSVRCLGFWKRPKTSIASRITASVRSLWSRCSSASLSSSTVPRTAGNDTSPSDHPHLWNRRYGLGELTLRGAASQDDAQVFSHTLIYNMIRFNTRALCHTDEPLTSDLGHVRNGASCVLSLNPNRWVYSPLHLKDVFWL